jgi:hypothetical protein
MADGGTMTERCVHCGHPMPEKARFCSECGVAVAGTPRPLSVPPAAPAPPPYATAPAEVPSSRPPPIPIGAKTLLNFGAAELSVPRSPPSIDPASIEITAMGPSGGGGDRPNPPPPLSMQRTMLGIAAVPAEAPAPAPVRPAVSHKQTMMGLAMPGIAPLHERDPQPASPSPMVVPRRAVTTPIEAVPPSPIVPAPAPLSDLPPPPAPRIVRATGGLPIVPVALAAVVLVVCAAGGILWYSRGAAITAEPRSSAEGKDVLHLRCDPASCKDGTLVSADGAHATFAAGEADLTLPQPLRIGDNALTLAIDRPGYGRDESLKLLVMLPYRVWADVLPMSDPHPSVVVRAQAIAGSEVTIDGKRLALDGEGNGAYAIDETSETEGPADESRVLSATVAYSVVSGTGAAQRREQGNVIARVPVAPLRVDSPRGHVVVAADQVAIAGRAPRGASVTIDGTPVAPGPDGTFDATLRLASIGEHRIAVRAGTPALSPRTVYVAVKRVSSLGDEARAFDSQKTIGYDAAMANLGASVGQPIVVDGEVVELRGPVMLVDDRRGCAKGPCATRVVLAQDTNVDRGATVRAYGHVARPFTLPTGRTVPEVEADFVVQSKR